MLFLSIIWAAHFFQKSFDYFCMRITACNDLETCSGLKNGLQNVYALKKILEFQTYKTVTHPSTDWTQSCLTSVIGQEPIS